ncbi:MAG: proline iminopeptidase-family hydrolase [Chitinophagaceae bacterium]|nr:proline iminopeptidase-family hydrolase [Chitinophagaceae bacterium]
MKKLLPFLVCLLIIVSCKNATTKKEVSTTETNNYLNYSGMDDAWSGGVKMIPIETPFGKFNVWTKRVGNNPAMKVLLLHGGPGATHEYFECFDSFFPKAGIEYYYYDQLESAYSDQPNDKRLWSVDRYVDEVEQVRKALKLDNSNFYVLGHSWGGILAMSYALKYPQNLKGLIISNMVSSAPAYTKYANEVLAPQMDTAVLDSIRSFEKKGDYSNPKYLSLVEQNYYPQHILRRPLDKWPNPVVRSFAHINPNFYVTMQGPSEFGMAGNPKLKDWDVTDQLSNIAVPTLVIGGTYDTMDPKFMEMMAKKLQHGRFLLCPQGSHLSMYDDQQTYFNGLIQFIKDVDRGRMK